MDTLKTLLKKKIKIAFQNREENRIKVVYGFLDDYDMTFIKIKYLNYDKTKLINRNDIVTIDEIIENDKY